MENEININDSDFEKQVLDKSETLPVVVDFWATWCGPCVMLSPIMERLAKEYKGKFILAKLNVEDNQEKAQEYGVMSIPAVKMFKGGEIVDEFVGLLPEAEIRDFLERNL